MKLELPEDRSSMGVGSAGGRGAGGRRKGSNRKKNLGKQIELSSELGRKEGSLCHPFPGLSPGDPFPSSDSASFATHFFFFFFWLTKRTFNFNCSPNAEPGPSLRELIWPRLIIKTFLYNISFF